MVSKARDESVGVVDIRVTFVAVCRVKSRKAIR